MKEDRIEFLLTSYCISHIFDLVLRQVLSLLVTLERHSFTFFMFGYLIPKYGYEGAPFLLAMVLGPMLETNFRQSLLHRDPFIFFKRPISAFLVSFSLFLLISAFFKRAAKKREELEKLE